MNNDELRSRFIGKGFFEAYPFLDKNKRYDVIIQSGIICDIKESENE